MADPSTRYRRLALLGRGSLGAVYRARDEETGEEVALKTLDAVAPERLYRLKREFRTLATLRHPALVRLNDLVVEGDGCFFTMELVDGADFVAWARTALDDGDAPPAWWTRLLDAAAELVEALSAVHRAGRLHRDLKPANVLVQRDGRVVLLDFDLALDLDVSQPRDEEAECVGTFAYMAPEQAFGRPVGPPADWYALGTMLYEAVTGRLPFQGPVGRVLIEKARRRPPRASTTAPGVPPALDALLDDLLDPEPDGRPDERAILETIARLRGLPAAASVTPTPFVGRRRETATLQAVLASRGDALDVVHVHGASGIGKTELVRRVLRELEQDHDCVVLRGRCHDRETVPFKAFDTIVDALSAHLRGSAPGVADALAAADGSALVRLFPVLARIPELDTPRGGPEEDPAEARRRAFAALRDLLDGLARRCRLVLWIDDLQWADLDSSALLEAIARPPAPPLALVLSYRSEDRGRIPLLAMLRTTPGLAASVRETAVAIDALDGSDAIALARAMVPPGADAAQVAHIAEEAAGSPFFVGELARHLAANRRTPESPTPTLQDAMRARVTDLEPRARELLEVIAVAGGPIDDAIARDAAGAAPRAALRALQEQCLVRSTVTGERVLLEMYHDRLQAAVAASAPHGTIVGRHGQIARALERTGSADPRALLAHYEGAGDRDAARRVVVGAADAAATALAFHRAAELYARALELGVPDEPRIRARRAQALVDAGFGHDAACAFDELAALREAGAAPPDEVARLRRRAAEQYLQTGHLREGLSTIRRLLEAIDVRLPRTGIGMLLWFGRERRRLLRRGFEFTPCDPAGIAAGTIDRIDTCFAAAAPLAMSDPILAGAIAMRATREALDVGHRAMVVRLLATMANREAVIGTPRARRIGADLLTRVARLAGEREDPYEAATAALAAGVTAFVEGRFEPARRGCREARETLQAGCRGVAFEIAVARAYELTALAYLGELRELADQLPAAMADADAHGALGLSIALRVGQPALVWLAEDRAALGRRVADEWVARWPAERMLITHCNHLTATVQSHLYEHDGRAAWAHVRAAWPALRRAGFLLQVSSRVELLFLRARAAVARADSDPAARRAMLRCARRAAAALARTTVVAHAAPCAAVVRASVARLEGRREESAGFFEAAGREFDALEMRLHATSCRRALGLARDDAALVAASDDALRAQGVQRPAAMASVIVAG